MKYRMHLERLGKLKLEGYWVDLSADLIRAHVLVL